MHFFRTQPEGMLEIGSWTIYDLVDDWIRHSSIKPGRQLFLFLSLFSGFALLMLGITMQIASFPAIPIGIYIIIQLFSLVITIVLHELCHALFIIAYGGRPMFGWKWMRGIGPVVYATTDGYYNVCAYRHIAAAPLAMISLICIIGVVFGLGWWLIIPFIFNAFGAGGDLLSLRVLQRYPADYLIEDTQDGFKVYRNTVNHKKENEVL
jgi:hypothetical protein